MSKPSDEQYGDEETARRRDDVIRRMANTPPKPHSEIKIGKRKAHASAKAGSPKQTRQASKGRVHKGKARA